MLARKNEKQAHGTAIEIKNLFKTYGKASQRVEVLKGINFEAVARKSFAIVGASGSGKSTLLHILGTLDRPDQGEVFLFGEAPPFDCDEKLSVFRNRHIGFIFQFHHLLPEFTAQENVMLPSLIQGIERHAAQDLARDVLAQVGLQDRLLHRPSELSGGEQQRVAIARAIIQKPSLLIADEPTGNLDRDNGNRICDLLIQLNSDLGMTLVMATHNMELARRMNQCFELTDGNLHSL